MHGFLFTLALQLYSLGAAEHLTVSRSLLLAGETKSYSVRWGYVHYLQSVKVNISFGSSMLFFLSSLDLSSKNRNIFEFYIMPFLQLSQSMLFLFSQCNNPMTKEPKLEAAIRIVPEWQVYDQEIKQLQICFQKKKETGALCKEKVTKEPRRKGEDECWLLVNTSLQFWFLFVAIQNWPFVNY